MLRRHRRILAWSLGSTVAALWAVGCSLQNFDNLKGEYRGAAGSPSGGSSGQGGGAGATTSTGGKSGSPGNVGGASGGDGGMAGTSDSMGGDTTIAGGDAGPPPIGKLLNPGFEIAGAQRTDVPDWTSSPPNSDAAFIDHQTQRSGSGRLGHWLMSGEYVVSTFQTVSPLPDGVYTFKIWIDRSSGLTEEYIFAKEYAKGQPAAQIKVDTSTAVEGVYTQFVIPNIPVTSGRCTVGIYTHGPKDMAINWANIDDAEFELAPIGAAGASGL